MKKWTKVFKLKKHDVLLLRLCNNEQGEYVQLLTRIEGGQYFKTVSFEDDKESADDFFDKYEKKHAEEFIVELNKVLNE